MVANIGFDAIRKNNRACWAELWKSRIRLVGAEKRWQAMADAAFFYLMSSAHPSSPASTSMFGLATWHDYHYYFGHVMWDIETFCVPPLIFLQPDAAQGILDYRRTQSGVRSQQCTSDGTARPAISLGKCAHLTAKKPRLCRVRQLGAKIMLRLISPAHLRFAQT